MPTVHEYYKTDFPIQVRDESELVLSVPGQEYKIELSIILDLVANAKFAALYFPPYDGAVLWHAICHFDEFLKLPLTNIVFGSHLPDGVHGNLDGKRGKMTYRLPGGTTNIDFHDIVFTGRTFIYAEGIIPGHVRPELAKEAHKRQLDVVFRDAAYAAEKSTKEIPRAFISHDSRDKDKIARPIATTLRAMRCPVWYDEFSLEVGQSLRESIEHGLKISRRCIFILTPNFLSKGGWPQMEYEAVFTREITEGKNLILPVWAGVSPKEVFDYSPILAGRKALVWEELGEREVCRRLLAKLSQ